MKNFYNKIIPVFFAAFLCSFNSEAQNKIAISEVPYQECHPGDTSINSAIIFIYRTDKGSSQDLQVYLDDSLFTSLKKGSYYELHTNKKGLVKLSTANAKEELDFNMVHGRAYYIQSDFNSAGKTKLKFVEPEKGYNAIMDIRETDRTEVRANPFR